MFFYAKKIIYLSFYEQDQKMGSAGFASIKGEQDELNIKVQIKNAGGGWEGFFPVYLIAGQQEINIGMIDIQTGCGSFERSFYCRDNKVCVGMLKAEPESIYALQVRFPADSMIKGELKRTGTAEGRQPEALQTEPENQEKEQEQKEVLPVHKMERKGQAAGNVREELKAVSVNTDKWEQLKSQYGTVHPFGDEREFISIEPKDFVVLREAYQRLVNNSFLLHGFYNYRHLILGKDYQLGTGGGACFYLGVPGVFFEREKMVAVMFGFEGFESAGPVEVGKFGYYLRRVEI